MKTRFFYCVALSDTNRLIAFVYEVNRWLCEGSSVSHCIYLKKNPLLARTQKHPSDFSLFPCDAMKYYFSNYLRSRSSFCFFVPNSLQMDSFAKCNTNYLKNETKLQVHLWVSRFSRSINQAACL